MNKEELTGSFSHLAVDQGKQSRKQSMGVFKITIFEDESFVRELLRYSFLLQFEYI